MPKPKDRCSRALGRVMSKSSPVVELGLVPVGRTHQEQHAGAFAGWHAADFGVLEGLAAPADDRAGVAQDLVDGGGDLLRVLDQLLPLLAVGQQHAEGSWRSAWWWSRGRRRAGCRATEAISWSEISAPSCCALTRSAVRLSPPSSWATRDQAQALLPVLDQVVGVRDLFLVAEVAPGHRGRGSRTSACRCRPGRCRRRSGSGW